MRVRRRERSDTETPEGSEIYPGVYFRGNGAERELYIQSGKREKDDGA